MGGSAKEEGRRLRVEWRIVAAELERSGHLVTHVAGGSLNAFASIPVEGIAQAHGAAARAKRAARGRPAEHAAHGRHREKRVKRKNARRTRGT